MSHLDWVPTLMAAAGEPDIAAKLKEGHRVGDDTFKVHLDGHNFLPYLTGKEKQGPRHVFHYLSDEGMPVGVRIDDWKLVYAEQRAKTMALWAEPMVTLRLPKLFNLRRDPFERADHNSNTYYDWLIDHAAWIYMGLGTTGQYLQTFEHYPPSQTPDSWSVEKLTEHFLSKAQTRDKQ